MFDKRRLNGVDGILIMQEVNLKPPLDKLASVRVCGDRELNRVELAAKGETVSGTLRWIGLFIATATTVRRLDVGCLW